MHRSLKLHHRKHTGKLIHHRHTSYWVLILFVLISGGIVLFIDRSVNADTLNVSATVPAPIPIGAPVFTAPSNNFVTQDPTITFAGTCPVISPAIIVALYRGNELLGSGVCSASGTFSIAATIQQGLQAVIAQVVTITGQTGESSAPLSITYIPPSTPASLPSPKTPTYEGGLAEITSPPLFIRLDAPVVVYRPGLNIQLKVALSGGTLPYNVTIQWGDGKSLTRTVDTQDLITFTHTYTTSSSKQLSITIIDATGQTLSRNYAVVNITPESPAFGLSASGMLDMLSPSLLHTSLIIYCLLVVVLGYLWHLEHTRFRNRIAIPMHYSWQRKKANHK